MDFLNAILTLIAISVLGLCIIYGLAFSYENSEKILKRLKKRWQQTKNNYRRTREFYTELLVEKLSQKKEEKSDG